MAWWVHNNQWLPANSNYLFSPCLLNELGLFASQSRQCAVGDTACEKESVSRPPSPRYVVLAEDGSFWNHLGVLLHNGWFKLFMLCAVWRVEWLVVVVVAMVLWRALLDDGWFWLVPVYARERRVWSAHGQGWLCGGAGSMRYLPLIVSMRWMSHGTANK